MKSSKKRLTYTQEQEVFAVYTNTDLTEGRGWEYPLALCALESTAKRLGRKNYVMGTDCPIQTEKLYYIHNKWYGPVAVDYGNREEMEEEETLRKQRQIAKAKNLAIEKAKKLGLTEEEIKALKS